MPTSRVRYAAYYHLWTTVILHDKPKLFGKAGRREDSSDKLAKSEFEDFRICSKTGMYNSVLAIKKLLDYSQLRLNWVILSHNATNEKSFSQLQEVLAAYDVVETKEILYKQNIMGSMTTTAEWKTTNPQTKEYLFLIAF